MAAERLASHHPDIRVERDGHVVTVAIDRPETKNACTGGMWVALGAVFREASYAGVRAVVLTGEGGNFCSGADLSGSRDTGAAPPPQGAAGNNLEAMRVLADVVLAVHDCPLPVISKVDGLCV